MATNYEKCWPFNKKHNVFFGTMNWNHQLQYNVNLEMSLDKTLHSPHTNSIKRWFKNFMETGSILDRKRSGRPSIDEETVDAVRVAFHRSPRKSIRVASNELAIPRSTVHKVLHKRLRLHAYKLQIVQALKPDDRPRRAAFAEEILQRIDDDNGYLNSVCFSDEATFHVSGKVNKHTIRIWGSQNPCEVLERERDSPKINVWCGLMHNQIIGPFIFAESTITANIYLDMLKHYVVPQLEEFQPRVVFQQDGAPPHWGLIVRDFLNETVATLVCFVFIVTSPILVSHALASVVAYLIAHTNFGSAQNGVFAVSRIRERIRFGCDVNWSSSRYIYANQKLSPYVDIYRLLYWPV